jgi:hypothetical protein
MFGDKWRFRSNSNTIFWWYPPSDEAKWAVDSKMKKLGYPDLNHAVVYPNYTKANPNRNMDDDAEDGINAAHGWRPTPEHYRVK